ncbi:MAG TPA: pyridoxal phosphate-dependent aminotransferase family protein [Bacteroidia bacterium]|nr:pyridoxal phosphate-dependent aminotransferase family protein [Bacteroidia bacterium]
MKDVKKEDETFTFLSDALLIRHQNSSLRTLSVKKKLIDFCSNDYLGFARSTELKAKIKSSEKKIFSNGSSGSRLLSGNSELVENAEKKIAAYHKAEAGLIFNSGYDANIGLFSSLPKDSIVIYDELIHASVHDGIKLSKTISLRFSHNDLFHLEERLKNSNGIIFVAVESVYSMDGDFSPLKEISALCEKYKAHLIVDEAHATGIFGKKGEGKVVELNLQKKVFARVHTFGKALGCHGAIVLGNHLLRNYLINFARSFIYTTALPHHAIISINCAYDFLLESSTNKTQLEKNISQYCIEIKMLKGIESTSNNSPIQCITISGNKTVKKLANTLQKNGFDVRPILSPTVPKNKERLRVCLHSYNTKKEISLFINTLKKECERLNIST